MATGALGQSSSARERSIESVCIGCGNKPSLQVKRVPRPRKRRERPARLQAERPNHIWAYDFVQDADRVGNKLYILTVMDEFTREGLATHVSSDTSAEGVEGSACGAARGVWNANLSTKR